MTPSFAFFIFLAALQYKALKKHEFIKKMRDTINFQKLNLNILYLIQSLPISKPFLQPFLGNMTYCGKKAKCYKRFWDQAKR